MVSMVSWPTIVPQPPFVGNEHGDLWVFDSLEDPGVESFDTRDCEYFDSEGQRLRPVVNGYRVNLQLDQSEEADPEEVIGIILDYVERIQQRGDSTPEELDLLGAITESQVLSNSIALLRQLIQSKESSRGLGRIARRIKRSSSD